MSEAQSPSRSQDQLTGALDAIDLFPSKHPQNAGAMLKQAREARGLHIAALAVLLKVPVKKLEALESNRLDLLPDAVFVRALASSVCRTLKIEPAEILAQMPQTGAPKLTYQGVGLNEPFRSPGDAPGPSLWAQLSRPAALGGLVLLLGAVVLVFLPAIKPAIESAGFDTGDFKTKGLNVEKVLPAPALVEAPVSVAQSAIVLPVVSQVDTGASVASAESVSAAAANSVMDGAALGSKSLLTTSSTTSPLATFSRVANTVTTSLSSLAQQSGALPSDVVVFTATTDSWVEATDAKGQVVLRRTLAAGEVVGASGALPLKVIVGRANATQVQIRGKAFDVNSFAKDNVARFEVK